MILVTRNGGLSNLQRAPGIQVVHFVLVAIRDYIYENLLPYFYLLMIVDNKEFVYLERLVLRKLLLATVSLI